MCRFITAVIPADADLTAEKPLLDKYAMSFEVINNSFVQAQINGDRYVRATRAFCDCDSFLGGANLAKKTAVKTSSHVEKLRKKGWSPHKIERWLAEKSAASQDRAENQHGEEQKHWTAFIGALLEGRTKRIGLMVHMYSGRVDEEQVQIKRVERVLLSDLSEVLSRMDHDILYMISESGN